MDACLVYVFSLPLSIVMPCDVNVNVYLVMRCDAFQWRKQWFDYQNTHVRHTLLLDSIRGRRIAVYSTSSVLYCTVLNDCSIDITSSLFVIRYRDITHSQGETRHTPLLPCNMTLIHSHSLFHTYHSTLLFTDHRNAAIQTASSASILHTRMETASATLATGTLQIHSCSCW